MSRRASLLSSVLLVTCACTADPKMMAGPADAASPDLADAQEIATDASLDAPEQRDAPAPPDAPAPSDAPMPPDASGPADASATADARRPTDGAITPDAGTGGTVAFRIETLRLRDPHAFVLGCSDITDPPGFFGGSINGTLAAALAEDNDGDGELDLSILLVHRELSLEDAITTDVDVLLASCTTPASVTSCSATSATPREALAAENRAIVPCLDPLPGTASTGAVYAADYPPIGAATAASKPCFVTEPRSLALSIAGATIRLRDARIAARYADGALVSGLIRGFVTEADADATDVTVALLGTFPMSKMFWGGKANGCAVSQGDPTPGDVDLRADGTRGWVFYLNFTARQVPFEER